MGEFFLPCLDVDVFKLLCYYYVYSGMPLHTYGGQLTTLWSRLSLPPDQCTDISNADVKKNEVVSIFLNSLLLLVRYQKKVQLRTAWFICRNRRKWDYLDVQGL